MRKEKAIVTGGAGFIGSHLCENLLKEGFEVISLDNYMSGSEENYNSFKCNPNFKYFDCDISDKDALRSLMLEFKGTSVIFNQAAAKKVASLKNPDIDRRVNIDGVCNMLQLSIWIEAKKFIHASTGSIYGEPIYTPIDENHPTNPNSFYGISKLAGEKFVHLYGNLYGMKTTVLRYSSVYGTRQRTDGKGGGVVSIFINRAKDNDQFNIYGDGEQTRCFSWIQDVIAANMMSYYMEEANGQTYNCASNKEYTINQLADIVEKIHGQKIKRVYEAELVDDIKKYPVCNDAIVQSLGTSFEQNLDERVKELYDA